MNNTFKEKFPKLYDENAKRYRIEPLYDGGEVGTDLYRTKLTDEQLKCINIKKKKCLKKVINNGNTR